MANVICDQGRDKLVIKWLLVFNIDNEGIELLFMKRHNVFVLKHEQMLSTLSLQDGVNLLRSWLSNYKLEVIPRAFYQKLIDQGYPDIRGI